MHNTDITWALWRFTLPTARMIIQQYVRADNKKTSQLPGADRFASKRASNAETDLKLWHHEL